MQVSMAPDEVPGDTRPPTTRRPGNPAERALWLGACVLAALLAVGVYILLRSYFEPVASEPCFSEFCPPSIQSMILQATYVFAPGLLPGLVACAVGVAVIRGTRHDRLLRAEQRRRDDDETGGAISALDVPAGGAVPVPESPTHEGRPGHRSAATDARAPARRDEYDAFRRPSERGPS